MSNARSMRRSRPRSLYPGAGDAPGWLLQAIPLPLATAADAVHEDQRRDQQAARRREQDEREPAAAVLLLSRVDELLRAGGRRRADEHERGEQNRADDRVEASRHWPS